MTLTPGDVRAVQFATTRMKTGYDMDEVDAFLDVVESDIAQLTTESQTARDGEAVLRVQCEQLLTRISELERRLNDGGGRVMLVEQVSRAGEAMVPASALQGDASAVLAIAQQTASEIVSAARAEAAGIRARLAADLRAGIAAVERPNP